MQSSELTYHQERAGVIAHWLVWVDAKDRDNGDPAPRGFWTGDDHATISIDGDSRVYLGAGTIAGIPSIPQETGLQVRMVRVSLTDLPEVVDIFRTLEPKGARVEIHYAVFDLQTRALVAEPEMVFAGEVDETPIEIGPIGGTVSYDLVVASLTRKLTDTVPLYKSKAALRDRAPYDTFRDYVRTAAKWVVSWGERTQGAPSGGGGTTVRRTDEPDDPTPGAGR